MDTSFANDDTPYDQLEKSQRKTLAIIFGNKRDIGKLAEMAINEIDIDVMKQIILSLTSICKLECVQVLEGIGNSTENSEIKSLVENSINLIYTLNPFSRVTE